MPTEAPKPISSNDLAWTEFAEVPRFSLRYRHLTLAAIGADYRVGVAIEELAPGSQSSPAHYHIFEEEHVFILEGSLSVRIGADRFAMQAGDYVCFPAGQRAGHCLINDSGATCRYVIVGERNPNEVVVFTDTGKLMARALGRGALFDLAATRTYWQGEDTGLPPGETAPEPVRVVPEPDRPKPPISSRDVEWREEGVQGSARFGGRSKHLTDAAVGPVYHVGMLIEAPAPGKRLAPRHYHMEEEEHALILEGEVTLLFGDASYQMRAGDYVCFPAGQKIGHSFMNSGTGACSYLMIGESKPYDVCVYPDSSKVMVRALRDERDIFDMTATRRYWDGEETG